MSKFFKPTEDKQEELVAEAPAVEAKEEKKPEPKAEKPAPAKAKFDAQGRKILAKK